MRTFGNCFALSLRNLFFLALLLTFTTAPPVQAQDDPGSFEIYLGYYFPEFADADDDATYGLRIGHRFNESFGLEGSVGRFESDVFSVDVEVTLVDLSFQWFANPDSPRPFILYGGPGWAFLDAQRQTDDSHTVHAGVGLKIPVSEGLYFRPDARARWYEDGGDVDFEATFAFGFRFGH